MNKSGVSWQVVYRRGGRMFPVESAGTFKIRREAETRRDLVGGWLAAGKDPKLELANLAAPPVRDTMLRAADRFIASRIDVGPSTRDLYRNARDRLRNLAALDPQEVAVADVQDWVGENADLSPGSLKVYLNNVAQILDYCEVEPNPARSRRVKLPASTREEVAPPDGVDWQKIKARLSKRLSLAVRVKEACALRTKEIRALTYGDLDFASGRLRVSRARTKRRTAGQRWVPCPPALLDEIAARVPLEDRGRERLVFPEVAQTALWLELERACRLAGVAHYPPHQLRHRRCSLWIRHGVDEVTAARWAGHTRPSMTLDVYGHVMVDPASDEWRVFWLDTYRGEREAVRA